MCLRYSYKERSAQTRIYLIVFRAVGTLLLHLFILCLDVRQLRLEILPQMCHSHHGLKEIGRQAQTLIGQDPPSKTEDPLTVGLSRHCCVCDPKRVIMKRKLVLVYRENFNLSSRLSCFINGATAVEVILENRLFSSYTSIISRSSGPTLCIPCKEEALQSFDCSTQIQQLFRATDSALGSCQHQSQQFTFLP